MEESISGETTVAAPVFDLRGFIENSLLEWEGRVSAVVIAGGCNFRCPYCHSWRYVTGLGDLRRLDMEDVYRLLERQRGWIDGVVFTGGEPTLQPGLEDVVRRTREYGVEIKLHSNGSRPDVVEKLLDGGLLDCLALDYKAPSDRRFFAVAGIGEDAKTLEAVRRSFQLAAGSTVEKEYHTTLSPRFIDAAVLSEMGGSLEPDGLWILQQYENGDCLDPEAAGMERYEGPELDRLAGVALGKHGRVLLKKGTSA